MNQRSICGRRQMPVRDYGPKPFVTDIDRLTEQNDNYRTALWTGCHLQVTLMCIPSGGEIGLEVHPDTDQFIKIEEGEGVALMGLCEDCLNFQCPICSGYAVFVPAGTWHNVINTGCSSMKIYTVYAPPHHPHGIVQRTRAEVEADY